MKASLNVTNVHQPSYHDLDVAKAPVVWPEL